MLAGGWGLPYVRRVVVYELEITLENIRPPIWRRVQVEAEITMAELHEVIQITMGWRGTRIHLYTVGGEIIGAPDARLGRRITDESSVRLVDVALARTRFRYEYDLGDLWSHEIVVHRVLPHDGPFAICVDGARACPPEGCGGAGGYAELLAILADPLHAEHGDWLAWAGGPIDAEAFDRGRINKHLSLRESLRAAASSKTHKLRH